MNVYEAAYTLVRDGLLAHWRLDKSYRIQTDYRKTGDVLAVDRRGRRVRVTFSEARIRIECGREVGLRYVVRPGMFVDYADPAAPEKVVEVILEYLNEPRTAGEP